MSAHWQTPLGGALSPDYFCPLELNPTKPRTVTAYHHTLPREGWAFTRAALGEPWIRMT